MSLSISTQHADGTLRMRLTGDLDLDTSTMLTQAIAEALGTGVAAMIVDLADTGFCDCAGISGLLTARRDALARGVAYQVVNPTGSPLRVLRLLDLYSLLTTRAPGATATIAAPTVGVAVGAPPGVRSS